MKTRFVLFVACAVCASVPVDEAFAQWYKIPQMQYSRIWSIITTNDNTIFVGADNATLLRSTDGGLTWTNLATWQNGLESDTVLSLVKGGGYIFAGTNGPGGLYRSSDNGDSWMLSGQGFPGNTAINGMTYSDDVVYAAANIGVYASTDSGKSWNADTVGLNMGPWYEYDVTPSGIVGITAVDSALFAVRSWDVNTRGGVYGAREDSTVWKPIGLDTFPTYGLFGIAAIDTNVFVATARGIFLYSGSDSTWLPRSNGLPDEIQACIMTTVDSLLFVYENYSRNGELFVTSDLGQTWKTIDDSTLSNSSVTTMVATSKFLFAGTQSGAWRIPMSDIITAVNEKPPQRPSGFALLQNYPNPFNPTTKIEYALTSKQRVALNVYTVLGEKVTTLVNETQAAGTYSVTFNAVNLPSGMYFYRLQTVNYSSIKKALLLK